MTEVLDGHLVEIAVNLLKAADEFLPQVDLDAHEVLLDD